MPRSTTVENGTTRYRSWDVLTSEERTLAAMGVYAFFAHVGFSPAWAMAAVHQAWFESGWNTTKVQWTTSSFSVPAAVGLFQINCWGGIGASSKLFANGATANVVDTPGKYWDATIPYSSCHRIYTASVKLGLIDKAVVPDTTIKDAYKLLLNSPIGGGKKPEPPDAVRQYRYDTGERIFGADWSDPTFSSRNTLAALSPFSDLFANASTAIPSGAASIISGLHSGDM